MKDGKRNMNVKIYLENEKLIAGITLIDEGELENGNMALHVCKNTDDVLVNRRRLATLLNCNPEDFVFCNQTHSDHFYRVGYADKGRGAFNTDSAIHDTDAVYTFEQEIVLCSMTADCVPVLFYHESAGLIGAIHSGWMGTVNEITPKLLNHLIKEEHCNPADFDVFIGMALSQEKFEVDSDVYQRFKALGYADELMYYNEQTGKYHVDNQMVVRKQLELKGINPERISVDRTCTYQSAEGFSYRQARNCGRHLSFIMRK